MINIKNIITILIPLFLLTHKLKSQNRLPKVIVKNKSNYSKKFIEGLNSFSDIKEFVLTGNKLIINGLDTAFFPETPQIGKKFLLTREKGNVYVALIIERLNYTTIDYKITIKDNSGTSSFLTGKADLNSSFFLGSESDESDKTGLGYLATEFIDTREDSCHTFIRVGYEEETGSFLLGKLIKNCNGKFEDLTLENFPNLVEKKED